MVKFKISNVLWLLTILAMALVMCHQQNYFVSNLNLSGYSSYPKLMSFSQESWMIVQVSMESTLQLLQSC